MPDKLLEDWMSTELVKEQIKKFLTTDKPEVLAIKGGWGVGKTHCWDESIKELKLDCKLRSYSYVSLFGVDSIDSLKQVTLLNTIDTNTVGGKQNVKAQAKQWIDKFKSIEIPMLNQYVSGLGEAFSSISQLALKDTIICFDDLERHGEGLSIKDFMGMVSFLKERKNCKVILLLNEDNAEPSFQDYKTYKEKIVDKQLHYEPSASESFDVMYPDDFEFRWYLRDCCIGLDIKNKRVITKIVEHAREFLSLVKHFDDEIKRQVVHSTAVISWCYYCHGEDKESIPEFDFINRSGVRKKDDDQGWCEHKTKRWDRLLNAYGFQFADEIDLAVASGIEQGFLDEALLLPLCHSKQKEIDVRKQSQKWDEAWEIYHGSFDANEEEVATAMEIGMRDIVSVSSCSQYSDGLKVLRAMDRGEKADELISLFIETRKGNPEIFNVDSITCNPFGIRDAVFEEELRKAYLQFQPKPTVMDILNKRKQTNSYNSSEADILNELSEDKIFELFMSFKGEELTDFIRAFLMISSSSEELQEKVSGALNRIAATSDLNRHRMAKFNTR